MNRLTAPGLVMGSALSTQLGSAFAVKLFALAPPTTAAFLRNAVGACLLLALLSARPLGQTLRRVADATYGGARLGGTPAIDAPPGGRLAWRLIVPLGVVLGTMNATFYEAISRLPLGDAVSIEFIGPIAVAVAFSQSRRDLVWVGLATLGILAIGRPGPAHLSYTGLAFIMAAAACWATYLVLARRVALGARRNDSLAAAMVVSATWLLLPALVRAGAGLTDARVLALGMGIGVFSSALPYSIELAAMPRVSATVYGVLLSLQPLVAALMGFLVLGQRPGPLEIAGFLLVIAASIGVNLNDHAATPAVAPEP